MQPYMRLPVHVQSELVRKTLRREATAPARPGPVQHEAATRLSLGAVAEPLVDAKRNEHLAPRTPPDRGKAPAHSPGLRSPMRRGEQAKAMLRLHTRMRELEAEW